MRVWMDKESGKTRREKEKFVLNMKTKRRGKERKKGERGCRGNEKGY
jgi:hypothetical protein